MKDRIAIYYSTWKHRIAWQQSIVQLEIFEALADFTFGMVCV